MKGKWLQAPIGRDCGGTATRRQYGRRSYRTLRRLGAAQGGGLFVALFGLGTYFTIASPAFLTRSNLLVVLLQISVLGMVAVPGFYAPAGRQD